jgi:hypothetical protein
MNVEIKITSYWNKLNVEVETYSLRDTESNKLIANTWRSFENAVELREALCFIERLKTNHMFSDVILELEKREQIFIEPREKR